MMFGYRGKTLRVNLSDHSIKVEELCEKKLRFFIGGSGLGTKYLFDETDENTDPLGEKNIIIFATGPFTGTNIPCSDRVGIVAKSPLTGIFAESDIGGTFGSRLKKAGFDLLVVEGKAEKPVYLWIHDGNVDIRTADHLWGKDTFETDSLVKEETDKKATIASIGPAGERKVRYASIITDGKHGRAAGRCGLGTVMGSKNLKSIAVIGKQQIPIADLQGLRNSLKSFVPELKRRTEGLSYFGTSGAVMTNEEMGDIPYRNWRDGSWEDVNKISGAVLVKEILVGRYFCGTCPIGCGRIVKMQDFGGVDGAGPEYETLAMFGGGCMINNLGIIAKAHDLCNRLGLDVISTGQVVAFAMELFENGIIKNSDLDGLELQWGNGEAMLSLIHMIAQRKGIGALLGEGVKRASERLGESTLEYAVHVKGLEFPGHDPRAFNGVALSYATSARGACHLSAFTHPFERILSLPELGFPEPSNRFELERKGELTSKLQNLMGVLDSLKICKFILFGGGNLKHLIHWTHCVTGWDLEISDIMKCGDRIFNLKRLYNVKCGIDYKDDVLPKRILTHRRGTGSAGDNLPNLDKMLNDYYQYRGWDEKGIPTQEKIEELNLNG